ncbi:hypothetical protein LJC63_03560 [Ruminococcaceae bacterium OttesenSCG-928-L11]|nr:hypothetical protein [Ruminococcaceae bacterium OttesenSCG-928-L11]
MKYAGTFLSLFIAGALFSSMTAYAYLDPGTGTMLLQVLAGAALVIGIGWRFIVNFFRKLFKKAKRKKVSANKSSDK